jgi:rubrerythrin
MMLLKDGKIVKEKEGLHLAKKNSKCPHCGGTIKITDENCPSCGKPLYANEELFSA